MRFIPKKTHFHETKCVLDGKKPISARHNAFYFEKNPFPRVTMRFRRKKPHSDETEWVLGSNSAYFIFWNRQNLKNP